MRQRGGPGTPPGVWVPPGGCLGTPQGGSGYPVRYPWGVWVPSQVPRGGLGTPQGVPGQVPPRGVRVPPRGGYPVRTTEGVLTTWRAVCLLRSTQEDFLVCLGGKRFATTPLLFFFIFSEHSIYGMIISWLMVHLLLF